MMNAIKSLLKQHIIKSIALMSAADWLPINAQWSGIMSVEQLN